MKTYKFYLDNCLSNNIIERREKVKLLINNILNKFLKKMIKLNIILFTKIRQVL